MERLIPLHHKELSAFLGTSIDMDPDWDAYAAQERIGNFFIMTARIGGELAGYYTFWIREHPNYKTSKMLFTGVFFLLPAYRGKGLGYPLFEAVRAFGISKGCKAWFVEENPRNRLPWLRTKFKMKLKEKVYFEVFD